MGTSDSFVASLIAELVKVFLIIIIAGGLSVFLFRLVTNWITNLYLTIERLILYFAYGRYVFNPERSSSRQKGEAEGYVPPVPSEAISLEDLDPD